MSGEELNIRNIFCVIYKYTGSEWKSLCDDWAQLNIYKHATLPQYRLVGWTSQSLEVILNLAITYSCKIKKKSQDFYKYIDEEDNMWGFGFSVKGESMSSVRQFTREIREIIRNLDYMQRGQTSTLMSPRKNKTTNAGANETSGSVRGKRTSPTQNEAKSDSNDFNSHNSQSRSFNNRGEREDKGVLLSPRMSAHTISGSDSARSMSSKMSYKDVLASPSSKPKPVAAAATPSAKPTPSPSDPFASPQPTRKQPQSTQKQPQSNTDSHPDFFSPGPPANPVILATPIVPPSSVTALSLDTLIGKSHVPYNGLALNPAFTDKTVTQPARPVVTKSEDYNKTIGTIGEMTRKSSKSELNEKPEKVKKSKSSKNLVKNGISEPYNVKHDQHVSFSPVDGFRGMPEEWLQQLQYVYKIPVQYLPNEVVPGYTAPIPIFLTNIYKLMKAKNAFKSEGIFRLQPNGQEFQEAQAAVDEGKLGGLTSEYDSEGNLVFNYDVDVLANLIKVWLRDMPTSILPDTLEIKGRISSVDSNATAWKVLELLEEPFQSIIVFLLDLFCEVLQYSDVNRMSSNSISICVGPNLFKVNDADPMASLAYSKKVTGWLAMLINHRNDQKKKT